MTIQQTPPPPTRPTGANLTAQLLPFSLASWLGFLAVGIPLPVLSLFVQDKLGFGVILVGMTVGAQSFATLISRQVAGRLCDVRGPKATTLLGLAAACVAGVAYLASSRLAAMPAVALAMLIAGRLILGLGESLFITAIAAWSVARVGPANAGRAMSWSGISMYGALAAGAPFGTWIYRMGGFDAVAACTIAVPLLGAAIAASLRDLRVAPRPHVSYLAILRQIWVPGLAMAFASSGVGTISAFLPLHFRAHGWPDVGLALSAFGVAYIAMRLMFGGLPDRIGGVTTALASLAVEAAGLVALALAPSAPIALAGAVLTGLGYSLIFPSLGVEALKRGASESRGLVLGAYLACFDFGVAVAGPVAGTVARLFGLNAVFAAAALFAALGFALTVAGRSPRATTAQA